jgi:hypothetical protein
VGLAKTLTGLLLLFADGFLFREFNFSSLVCKRPDLLSFSKLKSLLYWLLFTFKILIYIEFEIIGTFAIKFDISIQPILY